MSAPQLLSLSSGPGDSAGRSPSRTPLRGHQAGLGHALPAGQALRPRRRRSRGTTTTGAGAGRARIGTGRRRGVAIALRGAFAEGIADGCRARCDSARGRSGHRCAGNAAQAPRLVGGADRAGEGRGRLDRRTRGAAGETCSTARKHPAGHDGAPGRRRGRHRCAGTQLRRAGDEPRGNPGHEDRESEHRNCGQDRRGRLRQRDVGGGPDQRPEDRAADADHDRQHHQLDARRDDVAEHPFRQECRLAEQRERHQHEPGQRGELELDDGDEELHAEHEERQQHDHPRQHQHGNGHEVGEERRDPNQLAGLLEQRPRRREPGRCHKPRPHQIGRRHRRARSLQPKPRKRLENDVGQAFEVVESSAKKPT